MNDIRALFTNKTEQLFWSKVDMRGPSDCWNWTANKDRRGYGQVMLRDHKPRRASHIALTLDGRPRVDDLHAMHSCDNPPCVNPAHLKWGTIADNARDKSAKGRCHDTSGEKNAHAKLTESDVRTIRSSDMTQRALGAIYGVTHTVIGRIKRGQKWQCVK